MTNVRILLASMTRSDPAITTANTPSARPGWSCPAAAHAAESGSRPNSRRLARLMGAVLVLGLLACGCGKKTATAPAPQEQLPPSVIETFPAARSTRVPFETAIWARFREPLDSTTVSNTTVFLKVDTRRIPMTVSLEDSARRIVIRPLGPLALRRTHTIEFSPRVRTIAGQSLDRTYFWQFTTISVRRPLYPEPASGVTFESPVAPLFWDETEAGAGPIEYRVFHGPDSAQVEAETTTPVIRSSAAHLPTALWERGATVFWKVRARNVETGDEAVGPVWRFQVVPSDATIETMLISPRDLGYWDDQFKVWRCPALASGVRYAGITRFDLSLVDSNMVLADAVVMMHTNTNVTPNFNPQLFTLVKDQAPCDARFQGFPQIPSVPIAGGSRDVDGRVRFGSAMLAAQVQARIRRHTEFRDYSLRSQLTISYSTAEAGSGIRLYYFRPPANAVRNGH